MNRRELLQLAMLGSVAARLPRLAPPIVPLAPAAALNAAPVVPANITWLTPAELWADEIMRIYRAKLELDRVVVEQLPVRPGDDRVRIRARLPYRVK